MDDLSPKTAAHLEALVGNPGGSVLLHGPKGGNKNRVALEFARRINCRGCQDRSCASCRQLDGGNHPDVLVVKPEKSSSIGIDAVHQLQHRLQFHEYQPGAHPVIVISPADSLTLPAQQALLKTLEEPPLGMTIVLTARSTNSLLETVVSRCRLVYLGVPQDGDQLNDELVEQFFASRDLLDRFMLAGKLAASGEDFPSTVDSIELYARRQSRQNEASGAILLEPVLRLRQRLSANVNPKTALEALATEVPC